MATDKDTPIDAESFSEPDTDDNSANPLDLEPGEEHIGVITEYKPWAGDYGLVEIDGHVLWLNQTMQQQIISALVENQPVMYRKSEESESFEDSDGEKQTYHPRSLAFQEDDE